MAKDSYTMSSKSLSQPAKEDSLPLIKQNIPVMSTNLSIFDNGYALMKERFKREMLRIDQHMNKFSSDLMNIYGQTSTVQTNIGNVSPHHENSTAGSTPAESTTADWEVLKSSPLVVGEGSGKCLQLQFDVSQFDAAEINVNIVQNLLIVSAKHKEKTANTTVYQEYNRQFKLPPGMDPDLVVATLSRDGVLLVEAPLPLPTSADANSCISEP